MKPKTKRHLLLAAALGAAGTALAFITFGNIGDNLVYYWDTSQLVEAGDDAIGATVRLGGLVKDGTVQWDADKNFLQFEITDNKNTVPVEVNGAPPQMFRESIGVVVEGTMDKRGVFTSDRLMVKHSNEYRAPAEGEKTADLYKTVEDI